MAFEGTIVNGQVVFDEPSALADGTRVDVTPAATPVEGESKSHASRSSLAALLAFAGVIDDLPPDMSLNHDHYRLGVPKR